MVLVWVLVLKNIYNRLQVWPETIPTLYQYQSGMVWDLMYYEVHPCLIPVPIPGFYLVYTRQKSAFDIAPGPVNWYESLLKSTQKNLSTWTSLVCSKPFQHWGQTWTTPTSTPCKMDDGWTRNIFSLYFHPVANHNGKLCSNQSWPVIEFSFHNCEVGFFFLNGCQLGYEYFFGNKQWNVGFQMPGW
jgi:hypothetical protein